MKTLTAVLIAVIAVIMLVSGIVLGINSFPITKTETQIIKVTTSTLCFQSVAGLLRISVINDGTKKPVEGVTIYGTGNDSCGTFAVDRSVTPANGSIIVGGSVAQYFLVADYAGNNYSFTTYVRPVTTTNLTLSVPSGNLNVAYSKPFGT
jgi:hypothetical protein